MAHRCLQVDSGWADAGAVAEELQAAVVAAELRLVLDAVADDGEKFVGRDAGDGDALRLEISGTAEADVGPKPPFQQLGQGHRLHPDVDFVERI